VTGGSGLRQAVNHLKFETNRQLPPTLQGCALDHHETLDTTQFNQMAICKRADIDSHMAALNDVVERWK
jgi:hypothetical protein